MCVCGGGVYENGTYMYGGVPVCLYLCRGFDYPPTYLVRLYNVDDTP